MHILVVTTKFFNPNWACHLWTRKLLYWQQIVKVVQCRQEKPWPLVRLWQLKSKQTIKFIIAAYQWRRLVNILRLNIHWKIVQSLWIIVALQCKYEGGESWKFSGKIGRKFLAKFSRKIWNFPQPPTIPLVYWTVSILVKGTVWRVERLGALQTLICAPVVRVSPWDTNDVPHRWILPFYQAEWRSDPSALCRCCCCCLVRRTPCHGRVSRANRITSCCCWW